MLGIAGVFSGAEVIVPLFQDSLSRGTFAILSFVAVCGAFVLRMLAQEE